MAVEGIDGVGKHTQSASLKSRLERRGRRVAVLSFPQYGESLAADAIQKYLSGRFGGIDSVPPHFAATMYAVDRFERKGFLTELLSSHDVTIVDRYVASNLAYQGARVAPADRETFLRWLYALEHDAFSLPKPGATVCLDLPAVIAAPQIANRRKNGQAAVGNDIYETSLRYLETCRTMYHTIEDLGLYRPWSRIDCAAEDGTLLAAGEIAERVWTALEPHLDL